MLPHVWSVRVYYADTDAGKVVHHTAYLRFFEQARTESLRQAKIDLHVLLLKYDIMFAIRKINISYIKPAKLDDLLYIKTNVKEVRKASLIYEQFIYLNELESEIICSAEIKLACVNQKMQPCALPESLFKIKIK